MDERTRGKLALVIDEDVETRRSARALLEQRGYDVVHAATGVAALELIQRLPASFHLVLTELDLRGLPGAALLEALRLFRPDLPVICMSGRRTPALAGDCLRKPLVADELDAQLSLAHAPPPARWESVATGIDDQAIVRARARYASDENLVEAALELARGLPRQE